MGIKNATQATVDEAALELGVTPRTVINYIQAKEIEALKVGKAWFINKASLDAFKQRYSFMGNSPQSSYRGENFQKISEPKVERQKREIYPVRSLRLFQIAQETLLSINADSLFPRNRPELHEKFLNLQAEAVEFLGAGFYAFGIRSKAMLYNRSREKVGGMLSLVYFYWSKSEDIPKEIIKIEEELMPAFSSLIRKIEKKNERT